MKKLLAVVFLFTLAGLASAGAQTFSTSVNDKRHEPTRRPPPTTATTRPVGAFARVGRGNPVQLLNPRAPAKYYGPPEETVTYSPYFNRDPYSGSPITGLILVGLRW
ncbi:MAG: hypothetical protein M3Y86_13555 [Verrucomicrobiota bacterium]|nr:hypothetical protein [Verrucomicrobiota bacterium]